MPVSSGVRVLTLILLVAVIKHLTLYQLQYWQAAYNLPLYTDALTSLIGVKATVKNVVKAFEKREPASCKMNPLIATEQYPDAFRHMAVLLAVNYYFFNTLNLPIINTALGQTRSPKLQFQPFLLPGTAYPDCVSCNRVLPGTDRLIKPDIQSPDMLLLSLFCLAL